MGGVRLLSAGVVVAFVVVLGVPASFAETQGTGQEPGSAIEPVTVERTSSDLEFCGVQELFRLVNDARAERGLEPLVEHPAISEVAQSWARVLSSDHPFEHSPTWVDDIGPYAFPTGENIAYNRSVTATFHAWMNSPGHYRNIMSHANVAGYAFVEGSTWIYGVQNFALWNPPWSPDVHPPMPAWSEVPDCPTALDLVLEDESGRAVADRAVRVLMEDEAGDWVADPTHRRIGLPETDAAGLLRLHLQPPAAGTRTVQVNIVAERFPQEVRGRGFIRRLQFEVASDGSVAPPAALQPLDDGYVLQVTGPNLPVQVVDTDGAPISEAWVEVRPWDAEQGFTLQSEEHWGTQSDVDGRALVHAVNPPEGSQRFRLTAFSFEHPEVHHVVEVDSEGVLDHGDLEVRDDGTVQVTLEPNLPLRLVDSDDAPLDGVPLHLESRNEDGTWQRSWGPFTHAETDASGRVDLHLEAPNTGTTHHRLQLPSDLTSDPVNLGFDYRITIDADGNVSTDDAATSAGEPFLLVRPSHPAFVDVPSRDTHATAIYRVAIAGITQGCRDRNYCPQDSVTRAQMSAFLTRALDLPVAGAGFDDTGGHVHEAAIGAVAGAGIAGGYGDGTFGPNDPVTRAQMATFLTRGLDLDDTATDSQDQ